jgi:hypothetical protein
MTTDNENIEDEGEGTFDENESEKVPDNAKIGGYIRLIEAVVNPKDIVQRLEMSDIPVGKKGNKYALLLAQELVLKEMKDRREPNHKRTGYGTLALVALATIGRGSKRQFIGEMIQLKQVENEKDTQVINTMGRD